MYLWILRKLLTDFLLDLLLSKKVLNVFVVIRSCCGQISGFFKIVFLSWDIKRPCCVLFRILVNNNIICNVTAVYCVMWITECIVIALLVQLVQSWLGLKGTWIDSRL
ncbi:hypothetical protein [Crucivirus-384]|nr:hypothetical protein [Crucivirus-384]